MSRSVHAAYDGDLDDLDYHQDYFPEAPLTYYRPGIILPALLALATICYHLGYLADYDLLSIPELLWNIAVYLTPLRLIDFFDRYQNPLRITNPALRLAPRTHAAKSAAMRRIIGLDHAGGLISTVAEAGRRRMSMISLASAEATAGPPGLGNWDNSCYQNSVLQGLASLDTLPEYLTKPSMDGLSDEVEEPEMRMAESLNDLIGTLNNPDNNGKKLWTPAMLKNMSSWQQQDAQEYFSKVLDEIDKEIGKVAETVKKLKGLESGSSSSADGLTSQTTGPAFRNPLEGMIAQRVGCTKCGYSEGLSMTPFNCLTVPLGRGWSFDISECLDEYTKLEEIEGVECGRCSLIKVQNNLDRLKTQSSHDPESTLHKNVLERIDTITEVLEEGDYSEKIISQKCKIGPKNRVSTTKTRQAVIARPPRSLVVHFNRSVFNEMTGELLKNPASVRFPKILDLGPWCLGSAGGREDSSAEAWNLNPTEPMIASSAQPSMVSGPKYALRAVVTHYGRHENGHYICYKKSPVPAAEDDAEEEKKVQQYQWWRLSDDDVMKVSENDVLQQGGVFMLFFDLVEGAHTVSKRESAPEPITSMTMEPKGVEVVEEEEPISSPPTPTPVKAVVVSTSENVKPAVNFAATEDASSEPLADHSPQQTQPTIPASDLPCTPTATSLTSSPSALNHNLDHDLDLAAATPLPTPSDTDSDSEPDHSSTTYQPTKAIIVPLYKGRTGSDSEAQKVMTNSGNLVMV